MDLVRRWLEGWRLCRGLEPVIEYDDAFVAVLRLPGRERELFARTEDVDRLVAQVTADTWLTVTTQDGDEISRRLTAAGLQPFDEQKTLMSIELRDHPQPTTSAESSDTGTPTSDYELELSTDGPLEYVRLLANGAVAARGMAAIVGTDAVMHDIQTDSAHRRRGLGSVVMGALGRRAQERGARTGLLMATTEGFQLYRKLGWLPEATMVTASGASSATRADLGAVVTASGDSSTVGSDLGAVITASGGSSAARGGLGAVVTASGGTSTVRGDLGAVLTRR
jgi:GNAT superfamily N-acetyltransferase